MSVTNIVRAVVKPGSDYTVTSPIMKENKGQILLIEGLDLPEVYEIDFSNNRHHGTSVTMIGNADGVLIPTQFIKTGRDVYAFYYYVGDNFGQTEHIFRLPNDYRPDRTEEVPEPEQESLIEQAISALNSAVAQTALDVQTTIQKASEAAESARSASISEQNAANSAETAVNAKNAAEGSAEDAISAKNQAIASATSANQSANTASVKASEASTSAITAGVKADEARASAASASNDAGIASTAAGSASRDASRAESARDTAQTYANNAQASATSASQSATASANSASASAQSASQSAQIKADVEDMVDDAQGYAQASAQSASASANSAIQASLSESEAERAKGNAQTYASQAQTSAQTASAKAQDASGYAQTATQKATESAQSASQALSYKTDAESAKTASQTAQGLAESARDSAQGYAEDAQGYAEDAQASAESISASASQIAQNTADILKAFPTDTALGAVASFTDGADSIPLKSLVVDINPVQDLSNGDPSPENICPISGWTGVNVEQSGKNLCSVGEYTLPSNSMQNTIWHGNLTGTFTITIDKSGITSVETPTSSRFCGMVVDGVNVWIPYIQDSKTVTGNITRIMVYGSRGYSGAEGTIKVQFEVGSTATAYEPYTGRSIPISWQSEAGTVYGGKLDVLSGVLRVTHQVKTFDGSETWLQIEAGKYYINKSLTEFDVYDSEWISNKYPYSGFKPNSSNMGTDESFYTNYNKGSALKERIFVLDSSFADVDAFKSSLVANPLTVCGMLKEPIEIQLDAHTLNSLYGQNNIWADTGDAHVEYRADTKLYIEKLTQPEEDDMVANSAIASGQFFMIGNSLYRALANIASGATITIGTNAQMVSLADALNLVNS